MSVTLDISNNSLKLVSTNGKQVQKWGTASLIPGLVRDGQILKPQDAGVAIDALFKSLQMPKDRVSVTITGLSFTYRFLRLPRVKSSLMTETILRAAKKEMPLPVEEVYLTWQIIGGNREEIELFLLGVPRNLVDAVVQTIKIAGLKLAAIDLKSLALARVANNPNALVISFNADCCDIVLVAGGKPAILHTVIPRSEGATIEDNVRRLVDELGRTVEFYNITHTANPIQMNIPLLISGELVNDAATVKLIQDNTEHPVEMLKSSVSSPPEFSLASYAGNIGIALKGIRQAATSGFYDINVDALDGKRRIEIHRTPLKARLFPAALICAVVILILLSLVKNKAHAEKVRLQGEVDVLARELNLARTRADEATTMETTISNLIAETEALQQARQQVLGKTVNDADIFNLLIGSMPLQTDFSTIGISSEQITIDGQSSTRENIIRYAEALKSDYSQAFKKAPQLSDVGITKIDEISSDGTTTFTFTIVISR